MSFEHKGPASPSNYEVDPRDHFYQKQQGTIRLLNSVRVGLTVLALLSGITILGTSANAIMVYNNTHVSKGFNLALWPDEFDLRPTVALVVGSSLVILANLVSLIFSKVRMLQNHTLVHTSMTFITPFVGFLASIIAIAFFYAVNVSSTVDTLQSWSCQWGYANMRIEPHFGTLCKQSKTALYLAVILIPVEFIILTVAGAQMGMERKTKAFVPAPKPSSPALS
ncbi:hypothetical protein FHL15_010584 [Xylaria flabelliformis]|uniref:MARVEL domain-containing protein n=1 Tax=Xylaria flabelliformis TaxID=2512241 RepID=A0A553HKR5_9PEZI|nr:hypothetical protein FHL15_010584 [Xylaria flabelliformis]